MVRLGSQGQLQLAGLTFKLKSRTMSSVDFDLHGLNR